MKTYGIIVAMEKEITLLRSKIDDIKVHQLCHLKFYEGIFENNKVIFAIAGIEEEVYQLVGTVQANPLEQKISDESPLGKVILHAKIGDKVLVNTEDGEKFEVKIIDISEELGKKNKSVKKNK